MENSFGRGLFKSLRARVAADVREHVKGNKTLKKARYRPLRRILRVSPFARPLFTLPLTYLVLIAILLFTEWIIHAFAHDRIVDYADFSKDAAGFFLSAQVGLLAIITVAISVVTLLTQKNDGSAINTDVRLYYVESHAYALTVSGIFLSIAIIVNLFSPVQYIFPFLHDDKYLAYFKFWVTAIHALWLIANCALFFHFLNTTLQFVEPKSRARLRKQYIANEIVPSDIRRRLLKAYYINLSRNILGENHGDDGPMISFGMGSISERESEVEISRFFKANSTLYDVWLLPLGFALRRWHRRCVDRVRSQPTSRNTRWHGHLAVLASFTQSHEGTSDVVVREGGVPLTRMERILIGVGLRFARVDPYQESLPTPTNFIEQLVYKVVSQIDAGLPNGFDAALDEVVDFHSFVLSSQNGRDEGGRFINLAQVHDGVFSQPDYQWLREYRRAYAAAVNKMPVDGGFVRGMNALVIRLWPRDSEIYPSDVLQNILDLGRHEIALFENWFTKRAVIAPPEPTAALDLAGSDLRAYDDALIHFVTSWEMLEQVIINAYKLRYTNKNDEKLWQSVAISWPALHAHLRNTAYFVGAAVWNEDLTGIARLRDLEVRWIQAFHNQLGNLYAFRDSFMLTPDIFKAQWPVANAAVRRTLRYPQPTTTAETAFGLVLREAYYDVIALTGAVLLHWFSTKQQPSSATASTAIQLLNFEAQQGSGTTLLDRGSASKPIFRLIFDLLIRESLTSQFEKENYSAVLEGLVRMLNEMATPRMIPGRIYGGFVLDGFETLTPVFLAILAGNLPPSGDAGISELIPRLIGGYPEFQIDRYLRDFEFQFGRYVTALDGKPDQQFTAIVDLFVTTPDFDALRSRLKAIFSGVISLIANERLQRIQRAPLDETKFAVIRDTVQRAFLDKGQIIGPFHPQLIGRTDRPVPTRDIVFREIDRGAFTNPEMSALLFSELPRLFVEISLDNYQAIFWRDLYKRPKIIENFDPSAGIRRLLDRAREFSETAELGHDLILLVPYDPFAHAVSMTRSGFPTDGLEAGEVSGVADEKGGAGTTYAGTVAGIHVYGWRMPDAALLISRHILKSIHFGRVRSLDAIYDFELFDAGDPTKSEVRMWLAPEFEWEEWKFVEFLFPKPADDPPVT
uniref:hypothetical protein n=1 Tax=uncultured Rhizobium sp. TaxID=155567 RepID=UPI00260B86F3|nr:hypothetical protein [uncultured Rhizobium sp.]